MKSSLHPGADPKCNTCHGDGYVVDKKGERAIAAPCACVSTCPHCKGTRWISTDPSNPRAPRKRCVCNTLHRRISAFSEARIPARHAGSALTTFRPNRPQMRAFGEVNRFVKDYRPNEPNRGLVLWGAVGRGKTHLMIAMLRELNFRYGVTVRFVEFSHLLADLKSGFDRGLGAARLLDPLVEVDVLAIDELGKGRNTEFEGTVLDELVSRRYNAEGPILCTTNYEPKPARGVHASNLSTPKRKQTTPTLEDRVGPRVYSRLQEMCDFLELPGEDYRVKLRYEA